VALFSFIGLVCPVVGVLVAIAGGSELIRKCDQRTVLLYALGPCLVCGILLALHNDARFGSFTDVGARCELRGIMRSGSSSQSSVPWSERR